MSCDNGSLINILPPSATVDCGCECTTNDLVWDGSSLDCISTSNGDSLTTLIINIDESICELQTQTTLNTLDWCAPNASPPPASATINQVFEYIASDWIPRSGNDCACPITDDLYFSDTKGIYQCPVVQDSGYIIFDGNYIKANPNTQLRVTGDIWGDAGLGLGYGLIDSTTDLSLTAPDSLKFTYNVDATGGNITISLPEIGDGSFDNQKRLFAFKRIDCESSNTVTILPFAGETVADEGSIPLPIGHSYVFHAQSSLVNWNIIAEYFGGCDSLIQNNDGSIYTIFNLGVGKVAPTAKLDVYNEDNSKVTSRLLSLGVAAADMLQVSINGTTTDVIDEAGSLHLGGSNPLARLHITGTGATSATQALLVENSAGTDFMWVENGGISVIRTGANQRFTWTAGNQLIGDDSGVIRDWTTTGNINTLNYVRFTTTNLGLTSTSASSSVFFDITATASNSSGTSNLMVFDIKPTWNNTGTATGDVYIIRARPTVTSVLGVEYGIVVESATSRNGFGKATPLSTLETGGSFGTKIQTVTTASTNLGISHGTLLADTSSNDVTFVLPAPATSTGRIYVFKKIAAINNMIIDAATNGALLDGSATKSYANIYSSITVQSNGTNYYIIGELD